MGFLKHIDVFGFKFNILYKHENSYKTKFGGIVSLVFYSALIFCLLYFSQNLIFRLNPKIFDRLKLNDGIDIIDLTNENMLIAFSIEGINATNILNNDFFKIKIHEINDTSNKSIDLMKCDEFIKPISFKDFFSENKDIISFIQNAVCLNFTRDESNMIKSNPETSINIGVYCKGPNDQGINCFYDESLQNKFYQKNFKLYAIHNLLNLDEIDKPLMKTLFIDEMYINPNLAKVIEVTYDNFILINDFGILFESLSEEKALRISRTIHNFMLNKISKDYKEEDIKLISVNIDFSYITHISRRVYYKIQNVFAEIGGILNGLFLIGRLLVFMFSRDFFYKDLINDYFHNYSQETQENSNTIKDIDFTSFKINQQNLKKDEKLQVGNLNYENSKDLNDNFKNINEKYSKFWMRSNGKIILKNDKILNFSNIPSDRSFRRLKSPDIIKNINYSDEMGGPVDGIDIKQFNYHSNYENNKKFINLSKKNEDNIELQNVTNYEKKMMKNLKDNKPNNFDFRKENTKTVELILNKNDIDNSVNIFMKNNQEKSKTKILEKQFLEDVVKISYTSILQGKFCPDFSKNELKRSNYMKYEQFLNKIKNILELDKILASQKNIELIKNIFLNKEQRLCLNYVKFDFDNIEKINHERDINMIHNYLIKHKSNYDKVDRKILKILNMNIFEN